MKKALGVEVGLIRGNGGIFLVQVHGRVVSAKTLEGFPSDEQVVAAVREALPPA